MSVFFAKNRKHWHGRLLLRDLNCKNNKEASERSANYGACVDDRWIVGFAEEDSARIRMFVVEKKKCKHAASSWINYVEKCSVIFSVGWAALTNSLNYNFNREVVIYQENYLDPITGAFTQRI